MVSSGTVKSDASNLQQYLSSYSSEMSGLNGSWTGPSYDSISSQAEAFVSEYSAIVTQLNNFASAISEYEEYIKLKATIAQTEADQANASADAKASYDSPLTQMRTDLETRKKNINTYLTAASSPKLTATAVDTTASSTISNLVSSSGSSANAADNKAFIESILSEEGNTIGDYSGFNDGQWCSDFVSEMLIRNGYDIERSSIAGHEDDNTIFKSLERSGAAITTIEGNTSGAAGGSCVAIHNDRSRSEVYGYATPVKNSK